MSLRIKPAQLREAIDKVRQYNLINCHILEYAEAAAENAPPPYKEQCVGRVEQVRAMSRSQRSKANHYLAALDKILREDEICNGWKGEDRYIELPSDQQE